MLTPINPRDIGIPLVFRRRREEHAEEIERGHSEEREGHAVAVVGGVGWGEWGAETAQPVLDVFLAAEERGVCCGGEGAGGAFGEGWGCHGLGVGGCAM